MDDAIKRLRELHEKYVIAHLRYNGFQSGEEEYDPIRDDASRAALAALPALLDAVDALEKIAALEHEPATALIDAITIARAALKGLGNG